MARRGAALPGSAVAPTRVAVGQRDGVAWDLPPCQRRRELPWRTRTRRDSRRSIPGGGVEAESAVPEDGSRGGSSLLVFSGIFLPSWHPPTCAGLTVRRWGGVQLNGGPSKHDRALLLELKLLFGDRREWQGWLEPARFCSPVPRTAEAARPSLGLLGGCRPPADAPVSCFVFRSCCWVRLSKVVKSPKLLWDPGRRWTPGGGGPQDEVDLRRSFRCRGSRAHRGRGFAVRRLRDPQLEGFCQADACVQRCT